MGVCPLGGGVAGGFAPPPSPDLRLQPRCFFPSSAGGGALAESDADPPLARLCCTAAAAETALLLLAAPPFPFSADLDPEIGRAHV